MSYSLMKVTSLPNSTKDFLSESEATDNKILGGYLSDTKLSWVSVGSHLEVIDAKTGKKISECTFGASVKDNTTKIVCVKELITPWKEITLLAVGLESMVTGGMVCIFDVLTWKVLRAIIIPEKVTSVHIINNGSESFSIPGPLNHFDGVLAVGTFGGDVLLIDLCRQAIDEARQISGMLEVKDEVDPCQLIMLSITDLDYIETHKEQAATYGNHLAIQLTASQVSTPHFTLKGPEGDDRIHVNKKEVMISALQYAPQLSSLLVGYNFGALQIWNLVNMSLVYTSPVYEENTPVSHFAIQEPVDDPRAFCYFWAIYSNIEPYQTGFPVAVLYSLCYESKDWHDGYGYIYQNLQSCAVRFQADLSTIDGNENENNLGANCLRLHALSKSYNKCLNTSIQSGPYDSYALCLMVWNVWNTDRDTSTYLSVFDLNQWYKEQMPNSPHFQQCQKYMANVCLTDVVYKQTNERFPIIDAHINPNSINQFVGAQRLEEHYYPTSLAFDVCTISEQEVCVVRNLGLQRQLYQDLENGGPLCLMKPSKLYEHSIKLGLTPLFMDSLPSQSTSLLHQREHLLGIALENRMKSWLCKCATSWGNGSHGAAGLSLDLILTWAWNRTNSIKTNADRLCVSLFDYSVMKLDANANSLLSKCRSQILVLKDLYGFIYKKLPQFLINPEVTKEQFDCLERNFVYLDVLSWMINIGLLPECPLNVYPRDTDCIDKISIPYPFENLAHFYNDRRANMCLLNKKHEFFENTFLYIDSIMEQNGAGTKLESEWKQDGGSGKFPPPSMQALLRTYLLEKVDTQHKHTIVTYLFLDLAMTLDQTRYKPIIPTLIKFPNIFHLTPSVIKVIQAFWQLDHGEFGTATEQLIDPMIDSSDLTAWHHRFVLKSLMLQNHYKLALLYLKVRKPPITDLNDVCLALTLLISNNMINEAFYLQRQRCGKEDNARLLLHMFKECKRTNQLNNLINHDLSRGEEHALFTFMESGTYAERDNFKSLYFIQRGRYMDFYQMHDSSNSRKSTNGNNADVGKAIYETINEMIPKVSKNIMQTCIKEKSNLFLDVPNPNPMSTFMHNQSEHIKYKSDFIYASVAKSRETWKRPMASKKINEKAITGNDFPFLRAPLAFPSKKRSASELIYPTIVSSINPKIIEEEEEEDEEVYPTPNKIMKVTARSNVHTPARSDDADKLHQLTQIETPVVKRKSPVRLAAPVNLSEFMVSTPQSILKVRSVRDSKSPDVDRDNMITPEDLDQIPIDKHEHVSFGNSMYLAQNGSAKRIAPRKSCLRTPVVRFTDVRFSTSNTSSGTNTPNTSATSLDIKRLSEVPDTSVAKLMAPDSKNSTLSTDNESYYSPENSFDKADVQETQRDKEKPTSVSFLSIPEKVLTREISPLPGSPRSRKSYKSDIIRSSPRLSKSSLNTTETTQEPEPQKENTPKIHKRISARKSLSRKVLENNLSAVQPSTSIALKKQREPLLVPIESPSVLTIHTSVKKTEITKRVSGGKTEETINKYESFDIKEINDGNVTNRVLEKHEESRRSAKKVTQEADLSEDDEELAKELSVLDDTKCVQGSAEEMEVVEDADNNDNTDESINLTRLDTTNKIASTSRIEEEEEVNVYADLSSHSGQYNVFDPKMNVFQMSDEFKDQDNLEVAQKDSVEFDVTNYADYQEEQEEFTSISKSIDVFDSPAFLDKNISSSNKPSSSEDSSSRESTTSSENMRESKVSLNPMNEAVEIIDLDTSSNSDETSNEDREIEKIYSIVSDHSENSVNEGMPDEENELLVGVSNNQINALEDNMINEPADNKSREDVHKYDDEREKTPELQSNEESEMTTDNELEVAFLDSDPIESAEIESNDESEITTDTEATKNDLEVAFIESDPMLDKPIEDAPVLHEDSEDSEISLIISPQKTVKVSQDTLTKELIKVENNLEIEIMEELHEQDCQYDEVIESKDSEASNNASSEAEIAENDAISENEEDQAISDNEEIQAISDNEAISDHEENEAISDHEENEAISDNEENEANSEHEAVDENQESSEANYENEKKLETEVGFEDVLESSDDEVFQEHPTPEEKELILTEEAIAKKMKEIEEIQKAAEEMIRQSNEHILEEPSVIIKENVYKDEAIIGGLDDILEITDSALVRTPYARRRRDTDFLEKIADKTLLTGVYIKSDILDQTSCCSTDSKITDNVSVASSKSSLKEDHDEKNKKDVLSSDSPARRTRSASTKSTEVSTPISLRRTSLRRLSVEHRDSPAIPPTTPTRTLRARRSSTSTDSNTPIETVKTPIKPAPARRHSTSTKTIDKPAAKARTRSASVDEPVLQTRKRNVRGKSLDIIEDINEEPTPGPSTKPKTKSRVVSLPAIEEENKVMPNDDQSKPERRQSVKLNEYSTSRRLTRRQRDMLEKNLDMDRGDTRTTPKNEDESSDSSDTETKQDDFDLQSIDPMILLDKKDFEGKTDPDEEKVQNSPASSIATGSTSSFALGKRVTGEHDDKSDTMSQDGVSTPKKKKAGRPAKSDKSSITVTTATRRGRSASADESIDPATDSTCVTSKRTRKSSQDSVASDSTTRRSSRVRSKSEISDTYTEESSAGRKKSGKTELAKIIEEALGENIETPVVKKRGRPRKTPK